MGNEEEIEIYGVGQEPDPAADEGYMFQKFRNDEIDRRYNERMADEAYKRSLKDFFGSAMKNGGNLTYAAEQFNPREPLEEGDYPGLPMNLFNDVVNGIDMAANIGMSVPLAFAEALTDPETVASIIGRHQLMSFNEGKKPTMLDLAEDIIENTGLGYLPVMAYDHVTGREKVSPEGAAITAALTAVPFHKQLGRFGQSFISRLGKNAVKRVSR